MLEYFAEIQQFIIFNANFVLQSKCLACKIIHILSKLNDQSYKIEKNYFIYLFKLFKIKLYL